MDTDDLIDSLPDTPPEAKAERVGDTLCDVEAKALVVMLADTPLEVKAKAFGNTMANAKAKTVDTLADTLQPANPHKNFDILREVRVIALVDKLDKLETH